jgi:hypothetical protein
VFPVLNGNKGADARLTAVKKNSEYKNGRLARLFDGNPGRTKYELFSKKLFMVMNHHYILE